MASTTMNPGEKVDLSALKTRKLTAEENPQNLAKEGYDNIAQTYLEWTSSLPNERITWIDKVLNHVRQSSTVDLSKARCLDLGCGPGVTGTLKFAQACGHVIGLDISAAQIKLTRSSFEENNIPSEKFELVESDMTTAAFPSSSLEVVSALFSIIHLPLESQRSMFGRIYEWLTPGGFLLFNTASQASARDGEVLDNWLGMTAFWASFGQEEILQVVKQAGFEIAESETVDLPGDASFTWIIARKP